MSLKPNSTTNSRVLGATLHRAEVLPADIRMTDYDSIENKSKRRGSDEYRRRGSGKKRVTSVCVCVCVCACVCVRVCACVRVSYVYKSVAATCRA